MTLDPLVAAPAAGALRAAMRPMLRAVLRRPGRLYQPLYIGPAATAEIEAEIQGVADAEGVPVYYVRGDTLDALHTIGRAGVTVLARADAERLLAAGGMPALPPGQVVICGDAPPATLTPAMQAWVGQGLAFDPHAFLREAGQEWSMGPTLARCARDPGRLYNPVILVAPSSALPMVSSEAALRLEAAGLGPVVVGGLGTHADDPAVRPLGVRSAVVLDLGGAGSRVGEATVLLEDLGRRGVQLVILFDPDTQAAAAAEPRLQALMGPGVTLVVAAEGGAGRGAHATLAERLERFGGWPAVADLLVGTPTVGPVPTRVFTGQAVPEGTADGLSLGGTLQLVTLQQLTGRLVVYTPSRVGAIDIERGRIIHARILGDRWSALTLATARVAAGEFATPAQVSEALVVDRAARIGVWERARFAFVAGEGLLDVPQTERVQLASDDVLLEIVRRIDEGPRRAVRVGNMGRVWAQAVPSLSAQGVPAIAERLWHNLDGAHTLDRVAAALGLLDDEALDAMHALVERKLVRAVADQPMVAPTVPVHQVASQLLHWGLDLEARHVLDECAGAGAITPEGERLLAHLYAGTDPETAAKAFRGVVTALAGAGSDALDVEFNLALLEVRGRQTAPPAVWQGLLGRLRERGTRPLESARHYAICAELALRAGDRAAAAQMLDGVGVFPDASAARLRQALAPALDLLPRR